MLTKRIIPCLLLKDGLLVKTKSFSSPQRIGEPIYAIKIFNDYEADEVIIVDITLSQTLDDDSPPNIPFDLISKISDESWMPLAYGGGVRSVDQMALLFKAGVEKVCLNTSAILHPELISRASELFGSQSIVVSIDVRKDEFDSYHVFTHCGKNKTSYTAVECARIMEKMGAGEIIIHSIDNDGHMCGYDLFLLKQVTSSVGIPVIALGGAGSYEDLGIALDVGGASAAAAGSIFVYFGRKKTVLINYPSKDEVMKILGDNN